MRRRQFVASTSGVTEIGEAQLQSADRMVVESFRLEIAPFTHMNGGFELRVYLNDAEMTSGGAGLGMDPYDVLIPTNRLIASLEPHTTPIARCECGSYGCGATAVRIVRRGDRVHWDWLFEAPMNRGVTFDAAAYDREIDRVASDHSWETPERTAARLEWPDGRPARF